VKHDFVIPNQSFPTGKVQVEVIDCERLLWSFRDQWSFLFQEADLKHPFGSFDWTWHWWRHMPAGHPLISHRLQIYTFWFYGKLVGIIPLFMTCFGRFIGGGLRFLRPIGSDQNLTEIRPFLFLKGFETQIAESFDFYIMHRRNRWHFFQSPDIPVLTDRLSKAPSRRLLECFVIDIQLNWEDFYASRKRNMKEAIRKCYNAPLRHGIELDFEVTDEPKEIMQQLPDFYRLHERRSAQIGGVSHPNYFFSRKNREFVEICVKCFRDTKPILFSLKHDGKVVASRMGFVMNRGIYLYFSGVDLDYARLSVSTRLVVEVIKYAQKCGLEKIHLSTGRDQSKLRWGPEIETFHNYFTMCHKLNAPIIKDLIYRIRALKKKSDLRVLGVSEIL
jgi:CelD/BcsL family acetyltransferase involved in cellulose biosynthesis